MNMKEMFQEVDRRVSDNLMGHLFPKAIAHHVSSEWEECNCSYCMTKRQATNNIANVIYPPDFIKPNFNNVCNSLDSVTFLPSDVDYEPWETRKRLRDNLRKQYRDKLNSLLSD